MEFLANNWFKLVILLFILLSFYFGILRSVLIKNSCAKATANGSRYEGSYSYEGCLKLKGL